MQAQQAWMLAIGKIKQADKWTLHPLLSVAHQQYRKVYSDRLKV
jgi:hypothetical protein